MILIARNKKSAIVETGVNEVGFSGASASPGGRLAPARSIDGGVGFVSSSLPYARLRLVHRGVRYGRPEGGKGAARRADLIGEVVTLRSILCHYHCQRRSFSALRSLTAMACKPSITTRMPISALGQKRPFKARQARSAVPPGAEIQGPYVRSWTYSRRRSRCAGPPLVAISGN